MNSKCYVLCECWLANEANNIREVEATTTHSFTAETVDGDVTESRLYPKRNVSYAIPIVPYVSVRLLWKHAANIWTTYGFRKERYVITMVKIWTP